MWFHASVSLHILSPTPGLSILLSLVKSVLVFIHSDIDEVPPSLGSLLPRENHSLLGATITLTIYFHGYTSFAVLQ